MQMIIYSTKIHVKDSFNTITFIELAIQWNQSSCYDAIPNLSWDGSNSYTAEYNHRKFCIQILEEDHIVAIHFEREEQNDVLWSHDFILHDKEEPYPTISIQILRETRSNLPFVPDGKPPRFVRMLLDAGYGAMDYDLPISNHAIPITFSNYFIVRDLIFQRRHYYLPVVYVTLHWGNYIISPDELAKRLQGIAHVLYETTYAISKKLQKDTAGKNPHTGLIGLYCATSSQIYHPKDYASSQIFCRHLYHTIQQHYLMNFRLLYNETWSGLQNIILQRRTERLMREKQDTEMEMEQYINDFDEEIQGYKNALENMYRKVQALTIENNQLRNNQSQLIQGTPILIKGNEEDLYPGEIQDFVCDILKNELLRAIDHTRRKDVLTSLVNANHTSYPRQKKREEVKNTLKAYTGMTSTIRKRLEDIGFSIDSTSPHHKITFEGDQRYTFALSKSPGDTRGNKNAANKIITLFL